MSRHLPRRCSAGWVHGATADEWFVLGLWLAALVVLGGILTGRFPAHTATADHTIGGSESTRPTR